MVIPHPPPDDFYLYFRMNLHKSDFNFLMTSTVSDFVVAYIPVDCDVPLTLHYEGQNYVVLNKAEYPGGEMYFLSVLAYETVDLKKEDYVRILAGEPIRITKALGSLGITFYKWSYI